MQIGDRHTCRNAFAGLALGSWVAMLLAGAPMIVILLRRTLLEDKMLREGLNGYEQYAARVKYRWLPEFGEAAC